MEDNVQLREEELVGDEVVYSDIYPKTNTQSIVDEVSGTMLNDTLDRLQEKINNKLSRIVNSVNGRTGVVVLDAEDVGLGNVDNISFGEIKSWVINQLITEFGNKRIALLNSLDEAEAIASENQEANRDRAFFSEHGYARIGDMKSYIGYFYYDYLNKILKIAYKPIYTVGSTDKSLKYDTDIGKLSVRIWKEEPALKVRESTPEDSGLYINKEYMLPTIRYFDGIWGESDNNFSAEESHSYIGKQKGFVTPARGVDDPQLLFIRFHTTPNGPGSSYVANDVGEGYYEGDSIINQLNFAKKYDNISYSVVYDLDGDEPSTDPSNILTMHAGTYHTIYDGSPIRKIQSYILLKTNKGTLQPSEVIYCAFRTPYDQTRDKKYKADELGIDDTTLNLLTSRNPAFGVVRSIHYPDNSIYDPNKAVIIDFYDNEIQPGWSTEYYNPDKRNKALEVTLSETAVMYLKNGANTDMQNLSGMQIIAPQNSNIDDTYPNVEEKYVRIDNSTAELLYFNKLYYNEIYVYDINFGNPKYIAVGDIPQTVYPGGSHGGSQYGNAHQWSYNETVDRYSRYETILKFMENHPLPEDEVEHTKQYNQISKSIRINSDTGNMEYVVLRDTSSEDLLTRDGWINYFMNKFYDAYNETTITQEDIDGIKDAILRISIPQVTTPIKVHDIDTSDTSWYDRMWVSCKSEIMNRLSAYCNDDFTHPTELDDDGNKAFIALNKCEFDPTRIWLGYVDRGKSLFGDTDVFRNVFNDTQHAIYTTFDNIMKRFTASDGKLQTYRESDGTYELQGYSENFGNVYYYDYQNLETNTRVNGYYTLDGTYNQKLSRYSDYMEAMLYINFLIAAYHVCILQEYIREPEYVRQNLKAFETTCVPYIYWVDEPEKYTSEYVWDYQDPKNITVPTDGELLTRFHNAASALLCISAWMVFIQHDYVDQDTIYSIEPQYDPNEEYYTKNKPLHERERYVMLPSGPTRVYDEQMQRTGGIYINPDASLCVIPKHLCYQDSTSVNAKYDSSLHADEILRNWRPALPKTRFSVTDITSGNKEEYHRNPYKDIPDAEDSNKAYSLKNESCYLGINTMKALTWLPTDDVYVVLTSQPDDWTTNYQNYYMDDNGEKVHVTNTDSGRVYPVFESGKYYRMDRTGPDFKTYDKYYSYNASGLRIVGNYDDFDQDVVNYKWFGMNYNEYYERYHPTGENHDYDLDIDAHAGIVHSGGLSVNVGRFLEIDPGSYSEIYTNWNDGGKINVRIGNGLMEEPITFDDANHQITGNRIQLNIADDSGLTFDDNGSLNLKPIISQISRLKFVDSYETEFVYDPLPEYLLSDRIVYNDIKMELGKGLKLITDSTRKADFENALNTLTVVQLELYLDCSDMTIYKINKKLAELTIECSTDEAALQRETNKIDHIKLYHPVRGDLRYEGHLDDDDYNILYYNHTLSGMIAWAKNPEHYVYGISSNDDGADKDIMLMTLREFKTRCAYAWVAMDEVNRYGIYKLETLRMLTPFTEENTIPLVGLMKYYNWTNLNETIYHSMLRCAASKVRNVESMLALFSKTTGITYTSIVQGHVYEFDPDNEAGYVMMVCSDIRDELLASMENPGDFSSQLTPVENSHMIVDSIGEMWTRYVEAKGYTTAEQWLNDPSIDLTEKELNERIQGLAACADTDFDYGWSSRARALKERLNSTASSVIIRDSGRPDVVHSISAVYLKKLTETSAATTEIVRTQYVTIDKEEWDDAVGDDWKNFYVKFIKNETYYPYEANVYYKETVKQWEQLFTEPQDWDTNKGQYYYYDTDGNYRPIEDENMQFSDKAFFKRNKVEYALLTTSNFTDKDFLYKYEEQSTEEKIDTEYEAIKNRSTTKVNNTQSVLQAAYDKSIKSVKTKDDLIALLSKKTKSTHTTSRAGSYSGATASTSSGVKYNYNGGSYTKDEIVSMVNGGTNGSVGYTVDTAENGGVSVTPIYEKPTESTSSIPKSYLGKKYSDMAESTKTGAPTVKMQSDSSKVILGYLENGDGVTIGTPKSTPIYGYATTSGTARSGSTTTSVDTNTSDATKTDSENKWLQLYSNYYVKAESAKPITDVYTNKPEFVEGIVYKKIDETKEVDATYSQSLITDLSELTSDRYTPVRTESGESPIFQNYTDESHSDYKYYKLEEVNEYSVLYKEPEDWKTIDWETQSKYYNYQKNLINVNPGKFNPNLYYTMKTVKKYKPLIEKPEDPVTGWDYIDWTSQNLYYTRTKGNFVKIRTDIENPIWLDTGTPVLDSEKYVDWIVADVIENDNAGLAGFAGEDLNTLMLYALGQKWTLKRLLTEVANVTAVG